MAISWNFCASDYTENNFQPIPIGDHRVRIAAAEEQTSSSGNQMIKLTLDVSGYSSTIWHYIVFMNDNPQMTNQRLGELWDSFGMPQGNFNLASWVGKVGAARIKHDTYEGNIKPKVSYFLARSKQDKLPPWKEGAGKQATSASAVPAHDPLDDLAELANDLPL